MKTVTSISGGKTSAYLAAHYPTDYNVFALVCLDDPRCKHPDPVAVRFVNDKLDRYGFIRRFGEFRGTAEDDTILYTIMDLEQYMGREIVWVRGLSYEQTIQTKGGWLPNKLHRYCTTWMKIHPQFLFAHLYIGEPVQMHIGFRADENSRITTMLSKTDNTGFLSWKEPIASNLGKQRRRKHVTYPWQRPCFPLYHDGIYRDRIEEYWKGKPVHFAEKNNCVMCFHQHPLMLKYRCADHLNKMEWASRQEEALRPNGKSRGRFRSDTTYRKIIDHQPQMRVDFTDFSECDSGYCGL